MKMGKGKKGGGRSQKDTGGHSVPGHVGQDGHPGTWAARTGYTSENKIGGSEKSRKLSLPGKGV